MPGLWDMPLIPGGCRAYTPRRPALFFPERIILAKGSHDPPPRRALAEAICGLYWDAEIVERFDTPHNRVDLGPGSGLDLHYRGKRTLVLGEHKSALRLSQESGNTCPNYWHFSPYGFCPYDCKYCYLAATRGVRFSPTVKVFLNLEEMLADIDRVASRIARPTAFYLGKLQDGLALDPLTGYSRTLVPFFAAHRYARLTLLTKAADVQNLLDLQHAGRTILSWSLNPRAVCDEYEANTPPTSARTRAMKACAAAGYPVRVVIMPIIPTPGWEDLYSDFLVDLLGQVSLDRITLGGICSYPGALQLTELKLGRANAISTLLAGGKENSPDGRLRYSVADRVKIYAFLLSVVRRLQPDLPIGLCLEERPVFEALGMASHIGRCNCVL